MSSDFVLSITTKDTPKQKNPIHLVMWEGTDGTQELLERISQLEKAIHKLTERQSSIFFPTALYPTPCGIEVKSRSNSFTNEFDLNVFRTISKVSGSDAVDAVEETKEDDEEQEQEQEEEEVDIDEIVKSMKEMDIEEDDMLEDQEEDDADRLEEEEKEQEQETKEEEQEQEQEQEEETKEGEQQEEEETKEKEQEEQEQEAEEFKEFVWKGQTYYKDSENLVYQLDTDGDLIDTPIGIWKEETQKLVKYKAV
jgi:chemotaxis protein histidine kinase CheA